MIFIGYNDIQCNSTRKKKTTRTKQIKNRYFLNKYVLICFFFTHLQSGPDCGPLNVHQFYVTGVFPSNAEPVTQAVGDDLFEKKLSESA